MQPHRDANNLIVIVEIFRNHFNVFHLFNILGSSKKSDHFNKQFSKSYSIHQDNYFFLLEY